MTVEHAIAGLKIFNLIITEAGVSATGCHSPISSSGPSATARGGLSFVVVVVVGDTVLELVVVVVVVVVVRSGVVVVNVATNQLHLCYS